MKHFATCLYLATDDLPYWKLNKDTGCVDVMVDSICEPVDAFWQQVDGEGVPEMYVSMDVLHHQVKSIWSYAELGYGDTLKQTITVPESERQELYAKMIQKANRTLSVEEYKQFTELLKTSEEEMKKEQQDKSKWIVFFEDPDDVEVELFNHQSDATQAILDRYRSIVNRYDTWDTDELSTDSFSLNAHGETYGAWMERKVVK